MAMKRQNPEEIVSKLRQVDVLVGRGMARSDAIRHVSITEQIYYPWRKQYGGMGTDQLKELKKLQKENEQLLKAVGDNTTISNAPTAPLDTGHRHPKRSSRCSKGPS